MTIDSEDIAVLKTKVETLEKEVEEMQERERRWYRTGITVLGAAVVGLVTYIWQFVPLHRG